MSDGKVTLRFGGGGSLTFRDATHRFRTVARDEPFETDAATAAILLRDPSVTEWEDVPRGLPTPVAEAGSLDDRNMAELHELAEGLGLEIPARARKAELIVAIEAAQAQADEAAVIEGDQAFVTEPLVDIAIGAQEEVSDEDAIARPAGQPSVGTISIGDLPPGARIGGERT